MTKIQTVTPMLDMDGVLTDFAGAVRDKLGFELAGAHRGKLWGNIQRHNDDVEPWFYTLPPMEDAHILWEFVYDNFERVEILTASGRTPRDAGGQKKKWVGERFGWDITVNVVYSAFDKQEFAQPDRILIDDRDKAVNPFVEAGGMGILHTSAEDTILQLTDMMKEWE